MTKQTNFRDNVPKKNKPSKKDADLKPNTTIYFQMGLIVCLLMSYFALEMKFFTEPIEVNTISYLDEPDLEYTMDEFEIYKKVKPEKRIVKQKRYDWNEPKIDKTNELEETLEKLLTKNQPKVDEPFKEPKIDIIEPPEKTFSIIGVSQVPIFPGCENEFTREGQRQCMSDKVNKLIQKKFNNDLAGDLGLSGLQRISVQFTIDKWGKVTGIKTRAPRPELEREAQRVLKLLPQMTPGKQNEEDVAVMYAFPITLKVY